MVHTLGIVTQFGVFYLFSIQGKWLYEKYGLPMKIIWGIGILAAGQSSTMTVSKMLLHFLTFDFFKENICLVQCFCTVYGYYTQ